MDIVKEFKDQIPEAALGFLVGSKEVKEELLRTLSSVQNSESQRNANESAREEAESVRVNAESQRKANEVDREERIGAINQELAQQGAFIANYAGVLAVARATISINKSNVTIGAGNYYFYRANGTSVSLSVASDVSFTLSGSQAVVLDTKTRSFVVRDALKWTSTDIIVFIHDGVRQVCGGLFWHIVKIGNLETTVSNLEASISDIPTIRSEMNFKTDAEGVFAKPSVANGVEVFDTSFAVAGDVLDVKFELTGVSGNIAFMNADGTRLSSVGAGTGGSLGKEFTATATVPANFHHAVTQWGAIQNVVIRNQSKNKEIALINKTDICSNIGFAQGTLRYDTATGALTTQTIVDLFYGSNPMKFKRLNAGVTLCTFSVTGVTNLYFDPITETFGTGANKYGATVAFIQVQDILPIGRVTIEYANNGVVTKTKSFPLNIDSIEVEDMPSFITTAATGTFQRVMTWLGSESGWMLGHITDVHSTKSLMQYKHIGYLNELNKMFGFGLMCHAGDIGLDVGETVAEAYDLLAKTKSAMQSVSPWVLCKGNHDYGTQKISQQTIGNIFNIATQRQHNIVLGSKDGGYGYYDDPNNKVRTFFLNTSDGNTGAYTMSSQQLSWLISKLGETAEGWRVVVLTHFCPVESLGKWASSTNTSYSAAQFVSLRGILSSFVAKTSGSNSSLGLTWNFGSAKASLVCVLSGDSHFNNMGVVDGVRYIIRQGYGNASASDIPSGGSFDSFSVTNSCLFDVLVVSESKAGIFRIGAGGQTRDVTFNI